jgi:hypothetical protein
LKWLAAFRPEKYAMTIKAPLALGKRNVTKKNIARNAIILEVFSGMASNSDSYFLEMDLAIKKYYYSALKAALQEAHKKGSA